MSHMKKSVQGNKLPQTWDKYMQLELDEEVTLEQNEVLIINNPNNFKQTLTFVQTMLTDQPDKQITLRSKGQAMMKAIKIAEILKRKIPELHQVNRITSKIEKKHFVPLEEGLDEIILENETVYFIVKLFMNPNEAFENEPGYQAPLDLEEIQENEQSSLKQTTSRNTSFNQNSFNSNRFAQGKKQKNSQSNGVQDMGMNNQQYFVPFNNQMPIDPSQQLLVNPKAFTQNQMMLNNNQFQNQPIDPKQKMKNMNFQNNQQFQPQFGQFVPGMLNPQQMGINRNSEFNLDQSEKSDDDDSYESDSDQEEEDSQKNMFNQFGRQGQMNPQNLNYPNQMNMNLQKGGPQNFNNPMMMYNPNQMMMQQNPKNMRQINMQNIMSQQQFNQNRNHGKRSQQNQQQYSNQNSRQQHNNNNNNRGNNRGKNNKRGSNRGKNNKGRNNNRQGMQTQNSRNSYKNSQSFQSNNNSFAHQNSQQNFSTQPNHMHQNSLNSQSSKNLRSLKTNPMSQSQQQMNNFSMTKQNQPFNNMQQQNISQQQMMQLIAQQQQQQQRNNQQKMPYQQQFQQQMNNPMFQQMQPNPFLQKNQIASDQDDDDDSSDDQSSSEQEAEAKKKPNMLRQRIMQKNEKNQLAQKNSTDKNKNQALQMNQIGQNLFAQPLNTNQQVNQKVPNQINEMMQKNMSLKTPIQPSQSFPPSNQMVQNQNIQGMHNMNNMMPNKQQKQQEEEDSDDTDSEEKTENDDDSNDEDNNNPQMQQRQFQPPNQAAMNYFMKMNQQQNMPINNNQNFAQKFPQYMQAPNFEEMQKKMMLQNNQFPIYPNMKANLDEEDSDESEDSDDQSDNQFQIYIIKIWKNTQNILYNTQMIFLNHKYPKYLQMKFNFLHSYIKRKAANVLNNSNSSKKFFRILFKNLNSTNEDLAKISLAFFMQLMYSHKKIFDIFQKCFKILKKNVILLNPSLLAQETDMKILLAVKQAYNDLNYLDSLFLNINLDSSKIKLKCMSLPLAYNPSEQSYLNYFDSPVKNLIFLNLKATQKNPKIEIKKKISIHKETDENIQKVDFSNIQQKTYLQPQSSKTIKITTSCQKKQRADSKTFFKPDNIKPMKQKTLFKKQFNREKSLNIYNSYQKRVKNIDSSRDQSRLSAQIIKRHLGQSRDNHKLKVYAQNKNTKTKKKLSTIYITKALKNKIHLRTNFEKEMIQMICAFP